jgi:hypothetical protein
MMPGRGVLSTIARRFVYSRPDGDGASQSVGVSRQPYRNPGRNLGGNPDQLPSAPSAMEPALIDPDGRGASLPAATAARLVTRLVFPAGA